MRDFNYLGCNKSYYERKEVNNKVNKFQRMSGRTSKGKHSYQLKFYKVISVPVLMYGSEVGDRASEGQATGLGRGGQGTRLILTRS